MRPYSVNPRFPGLWLVPASPAPLQRQNRVSAGLSATYQRAKRSRVIRVDRSARLTDLALRLSVLGTLDPLAAIRFDLGKRPCGCCGSMQGGKLYLKVKPLRGVRNKALRLNPDRLP